MKKLVASIMIPFLMAFIISAAGIIQATTIYLPVVYHAPEPTVEPPPPPLLVDCIPQSVQRETVSVASVVDGDTIYVTRGGLQQSLRYIGIDSPEDTNAQEVYGPEATARNKELVEGKQVTIVRDVSEVDQYGRILRYVFAGDIFVNYQLVREGFAQAISYPPDTACYNYFKEAENQAKSEGRGIWTPSPQPGVCNCTGPDLDCVDFGTHASAQSCFDYCWSQGYGDIFSLDADGDGLACETLP